MRRVTCGILFAFLISNPSIAQVRISGVAGATKSLPIETQDNLTALSISRYDSLPRCFDAEFPNDALEEPLLDNDGFQAMGIGDNGEVFGSAPKTHVFPDGVLRQQQAAIYSNHSVRYVGLSRSLFEYDANSVTAMARDGSFVSQSGGEYVLFDSSGTRESIAMPQLADGLLIWNGQFDRFGDDGYLYGSFEASTPTGASVSVTIKTNLSIRPLVAQVTNLSPASSISERLVWSKSNAVGQRTGVLATFSPFDRRGFILDSSGNVTNLPGIIAWTSAPTARGEFISHEFMTDAANYPFNRQALNNRDGSMIADISLIKLGGRKLHADFGSMNKQRILIGTVANRDVPAGDAPIIMRLGQAAKYITDMLCTPLPANRKDYVYFREINDRNEILGLAFSRDLTSGSSRLEPIILRPNYMTASIGAQQIE